MWPFNSTTGGGGSSSPSTLETILSGIGDLGKSLLDTQVQKKQIDAFTALQTLQLQNQASRDYELERYSSTVGGSGGILLLGLLAVGAVAVVIALKD